MWGKVRTYGLTRLLGGGGLVVVFLTPGCVTQPKWEPVPAKVTTKVYDERDTAVRLLREWQEVIKQPQFWMHPPYYHHKAAAEKFLEEQG